MGGTVKVLPIQKPNVMKDDVDNMKKRSKSILITFMLLATLMFVTACVDNFTAYDKLDAKGYTVSVRFDANGGLFASNTSVIVDSYNISDMAKNDAGNAELALLAPNDSVRGEGNHYNVNKSGYFLAGWYTERTETGTDEKGNPTYTYANKWDFANDLLEVDGSKTYSASEPVVTLYAAWVPEFQVNFISLDNNEPVGTYKFSPTASTEIKVPEWNDGAMKMYNFPKRDGYTFEAAYYDQAATKLVEGTLTHPGTVNEETGTAENGSIDVYVNWKEGEWYQISTVKQFQTHAHTGGSYELLADLDFDDSFWPEALIYGNFNGTIVGNGHTISNVSVEQTNNSKANAGLFGALGEKAKITDLTFENVTFTVKKGVRVTGASIGLLAGSISSNATVSNLRVINGTLQVDAGCYFPNDDYVIGKICGTGYDGRIDCSTIVCKVVGDETKLIIVENDNAIALEFKK